MQLRVCLAAEELTELNARLYLETLNFEGNTTGAERML